MDDLFGEEREAMWRAGLRVYGGNLIRLGEMLRSLADNPDTAEVKARSDRLADLIRTTAVFIERYGPDYPPHRLS